MEGKRDLKSELITRRCGCGIDFLIHPVSSATTCSAKCAATYKGDPYPETGPLPEAEASKPSIIIPPVKTEAEASAERIQETLRQLKESSVKGKPDSPSISPASMPLAIEKGKTLKIIYPESIPPEILIRALQSGLSKAKWTLKDGLTYEIRVEMISGDYTNQKIILGKSRTV